MSSQIERRLIECLDALESGESVEDILQRYPEDAAELRAMLAVSEALPRLAAPISASAERRSEQAFLAAAAAMQSATPVRRGLFRFNVSVFQFVATVLIVFGLGSILFGSIQSSLPGDDLYGAKLSLEAIRLQLGASSDLAARFNERRITEIRRLLATGQEADVSFAGAIEAMESNEWVVAGLTVTLQPETTITGSPVIGSQVVVKGRVDNGQLLAREITVRDQTQPILTETVIPSEAPEADSSETLTPDEVVTEHTPTPTMTDEPSATPVPNNQPALNPTLPPIPTIVPTDDLDGGDPTDTPSDDGGDDGQSGDDSGGSGDDGGSDSDDGGSDDDGSDDSSDNSGSGSNKGSGDSSDDDSKDDEKDDDKDTETPEPSETPETPEPTESHDDESDG